MPSNIIPKDLLSFYNSHEAISSVRMEIGNDIKTLFQQQQGGTEEKCQNLHSRLNIGSHTSVNVNFFDSGGDSTLISPIKGYKGK
jgi:hypothetical protein